MVPKREKMISRSSSVVTGFSLHTNRTFSGGLMSASGRSPTWRKVQQTVVVPQCTSSISCRAFTHHLQQDGLSFRLFFPQPLLQLLGSFPLGIIDVFVRSDATALQQQNVNGGLRLPIFYSCTITTQKRLG